ncbi:hypothetical protein D5086_008997 [Populus alba]|uniref:Uncharacterized protein n=1 Tax=Populus alba TaxID=43335 RepID=A0ACC4CIK7_POPAL
MTQNSLVIDAVRLATQFLAPKGTFVTKGKKDLVAVDTAGYDDENGGLRDSDNEETQENSSSDVDSDEERRIYLHDN